MVQSLKSKSTYVPFALYHILPCCHRPGEGRADTVREWWFLCCSFGLLCTEMFWNLKFYFAIFISYLKHSFCTLENDEGLRVPRTSLNWLGVNSYLEVLISPYSYHTLLRNAKKLLGLQTFFTLPFYFLKYCFLIFHFSLIL